MADVHDKLRACYDRHDHEWRLLSARLGTLMTSQAFLVAACAAVYSSANMTLDRQPVILLVAGIAATICLLSSIAIAINCRVIRDWHILIHHHVADHAGDLDGYHIPRGVNDIRHLLASDVFSVALPMLFGGLWAVVLWKVIDWPETLPVPPEYVVAGGFAVWVALIGVVYLFGSLYRLNGRSKKAVRRR